MIYWNNDASFLNLVWDHLFMPCSDIWEEKLNFVMEKLKKFTNFIIFCFSKIDIS